MLRRTKLPGRTRASVFGTTARIAERLVEESDMRLLFDSEFLVGPKGPFFLSAGFLMDTGDAVGHQR